MILKKIAIFPIQAKSLLKEDIYFTKALSLFIHLSLETTLYLSSSIVKLISSDGNIISEDFYIKYSIDELLNIYNDKTIDYLLFLDISKNSNSYLVTYYIYNGNNKKLKKTRNYILNENLFEDTYKMIISDILTDMGESILINTDNKSESYEMYITDYSLFKKIKDIIKYDDSFFYTEDSNRYISELKKIYFEYREISIIRYIIKKLLAVNNIFFVYEIINSIKINDENNDYTLLLLATTLIEFRQYREAINLLNEINTKSVFYMLKQGLINTLKAEAYLKLNNLKPARKYIMKSVKTSIRFDGTYELFLEIMFKSNFFLAFKSYLELDKYKAVRNSSYKANYWIAKYYSEVSIDNRRALSVIEDFKFNINIIFIYLKILYRISIENNNYDKLNDYILNLYTKKVFEYKETSGNNMGFVKLFIKTFLYIKQKSNILSFSVKEKIILEPYKEIQLTFDDIEKIIFNYIYDNVSLDIPVINKLLFFILKDYETGVNKLKEEKEIYYYTKALINDKYRLKFLKKSLKLKMDISVLNKIIICYHSSKKYLKMKKYLKIRKKYIKNDEFDVFYTIKLMFLRKQYRKSLELMEKLEINSQEIELLKVEIYFNIKEYDKMLDMMKKYNSTIIKNSYLSYLNGWVLLKIKNNRKGLFYLQNSYNLNPNKILQKLLIKEYKRYGIDYMKE